MTWIISDESSPENRRFCRAILSKYGKRLSPKIYLIESKAVLNSTLSEIQWCNGKGLELSYKLTRVEESDILFGLE